MLLYMGKSVQGISDETTSRNSSGILFCICPGLVSVQISGIASTTLRLSVVICTISLKKERQLGRESLATVLMLYLCSSPFPYQSWLLWSARLSTLSCDLIPHCFNSQSLTGKKWVVVNWKVGQSLVFCFPTGGETVIASVIVSWRIGEIKN